MTAFIFPGQGTQYVGMGSDLYEAFPKSKEVFDSADRVLGLPLSKLCFEGPIEELTRTVNCQPAIFTASIAAFAAFKSAIRSQLSAVSYMAGLSSGEYTALVAAGAFSFEDGITLVSKRARFMEEAAAIKAGRMSSILGLDLDTLKKVVDESGAEIANLNCPGQIVISGSLEAVDKANSLALQYGAKRAVILEVSGAFHSSLMEPASTRLKEVLDKIYIEKPKVTVVSNVKALPETTPAEIKENLIRQLTSSVFWDRSIRFMIGQGVSEFFEIGPGKVLKGLIRKIDPNVKVTNIENKQDIDKVSE